MNEATKKKLIIPFMLFAGMLGVNVNSIIRGIDEHQPWRIVIAAASLLLIAGLMVFILVKARQSPKQTS